MVDWLVIGGGVAGSVVASRLGSHGATVTVVDAGPDTPTGDDLFDALEVPSRVTSVPRVHRVAGGPVVPYTAGIGLGGGSAINGSILSTAGPFAHDHRLPMEYLGGVHRSTRRGGRVNTWQAYEPLVAATAVTTVLSTYVEHLLMENGRCVGLRTQSGDELTAANTVVCAGALATAPLLLRSGLAIEGLGNGIQDHPAVALVHERTKRFGSDGPSVAALERRGPLQVMHLRRLGTADDGRAATVVMLMRPLSRGRMWIDESGDPVISFDIGSDPADVAVLEAGVREVMSHDLRGADSAVSGAGDLSAWLRDQLATTVPVVTHAASGCAMGAVVDRFGRPRGIDGLYVVDASVFPAVPAVNPMLPTVQLAETVVDRWIAAGLA